MSNAVSLDLLGENDVSKIYLVNSQSLGQKHCFLITKICKRLLENVLSRYPNKKLKNQVNTEGTLHWLQKSSLIMMRSR